MSRLDILSNLAGKLEDAKTNAIVDGFNEMLRGLVTNRETFGRLDYPKLARQVNYLAWAIGEEKNQRQSRSSTSKKAQDAKPAKSIKGPAWKDVADGINALAEKRGAEFGADITTTVSNDQIRDFASFKTTATGVSSSKFYVAIALYLIDADDTGQMERDFFKHAIPQRERDLPKVLFEELSAALRSETALNDRDVGTNHEVTVNFNIKKSNTDKFARYFDQFTFSDDGRLHMVVYRPRRSKPSSLIKTFLSVNRHEQELHSFGFAHFYEPVDGPGYNRFSAGKVLPMENGVYFAGGQKPQVDDQRQDQPFHSLKTLAIRWSELNNNADLLPGLAMSTNYDGQQLISRVALRVTPIPHSDEIPLRNVPNGDLFENLRHDIELEKAVVKKAEAENAKFLENASNFQCTKENVDLKAMTEKILALTNNRPSSDSGFAVPEGFSLSAGKKRQNFSLPRLETLIEEIFQANGNTCEDEVGRPYEFWSDTRFGPITFS